MVRPKCRSLHAVQCGPVPCLRLCHLSFARVGLQVWDWLRSSLGSWVPGLRRHPVLCLGRGAVSHLPRGQRNARPDAVRGLCRCAPWFLVSFPRLTAFDQPNFISRRIRSRPVCRAMHPTPCKPPERFVDPGEPGCGFLLMPRCTACPVSTIRARLALRAQQVATSRYSRSRLVRCRVCLLACGHSNLLQSCPAAKYSAQGAVNCTKCPPLKVPMIDLSHLARRVTYRCRLGTQQTVVGPAVLSRCALTPEPVLCPSGQLPRSSQDGCEICPAVSIAEAFAADLVWIGPLWSKWIYGLVGSAGFDRADSCMVAKTALPTHIAVSLGNLSARRAHCSRSRLSGAPAPAATVHLPLCSKVRRACPAAPGATRSHHPQPPVRHAHSAKIPTCAHNAGELCSPGSYSAGGSSGCDPCPGVAAVSFEQR